MDVSYESKLVLGLDVSTKTIGIALFEDNDGAGNLKLLHHVTPKVKPEPESKMEELFQKARIFESEFLNDYAGMGITRVIIEEPLLQSNNVNTDIISNTNTLLDSLVNITVKKRIKKN